MRPKDKPRAASSFEHEAINNSRNLIKYPMARCCAAVHRCVALRSPTRNKNRTLFTIINKALHAKPLSINSKHVDSNVIGASSSRCSAAASWSYATILPDPDHCFRFDARLFRSIEISKWRLHIVIHHC